MKELKLRLSLKALPEDVYAALTNKKIIEIWTAEPAEMEVEPNTEFSWFDGAICGQNILFDPNKRIIQHWYFGENEPSEVIILIHPDKNGCQVEVKQSNIPDIDFDDIKEGWTHVIFEGLKDLLED